LRTPFVALSLATLLGSCSTPHVSLREGAREYVASDYPQVLDRWTRERSLITAAEMDDVLTVTATYESWDFRWAYVVRYAQDYRLTVDERRTLLDKMLKETKEGHLFYVALYGSNQRWSDLTRPTPAWIVRLIDDQGNETAPATVELVQRPGSLERRYFPYTTVWRRVFRIRFPRFAADGKTPTIAPNAAFVGLRFAGAEGNQELKWELDKATASKVAFGPRDGDEDGDEARR
jgi:hypothetical protein